MAQVVVLVSRHHQFYGDWRNTYSVYHMQLAILPISFSFRRLSASFDNISDFITKVAPYVLHRGLCVFYGVMKQPGGYDGLFAAHLLQNHGHANRMGDIRHTTGFTALSLMCARGEANGSIY
jgi:hypothetical protein